MHTKYPRVVLTDHAIGRIAKRSTKTPGQVRAMLTTQIFRRAFLGLPVMADGSIEIDVDGEIYAVAYPTLDGCWSVATVKRFDGRDSIEEGIA